ncbi:hypothetical protein [Methylobacterium sp. 22177]|uniref:hypothetical protein n=1 Tax=Methylobacterium sp. 22177 TaxID=3453885 RepID=UPI003F84CACD
MFEPDKWPQRKEEYSSRIIVSEWSEQSFGLLCLQEIDLGPGNDPRIVNVEGRPIILYRGALHDQNPYYLYDLSARKNLPIEIGDKWFSYGKNWIPFDDNGMLGAVHSLAPFRLLQINPNDGKGCILAEHRNSFEPRTAHDNFNIFRGGSNALSLCDKLIGFGHATFSPWRHHPFLWDMDVGGRINTITSTAFDAIFSCGYGIIDPTSLFRKSDGKFFLGICGSERDWFFDQRFVEALLPIELTTSVSCNGPAVDTSAFKNFPTSFTLVASDLQSNISTTIVPYGGRHSSDQEGFLSFGPFMNLRPGQYHLIFRYRSEALPSEECGWVDGCVCVLGSARSLGKLVLNGTRGNTSTAHLFIDIKLEQNERFSVQFYTNGLRPITFFDVRVGLTRADRS